MIIVQLKGGFGNQLFQYAAASTLAHQHHVPVKVDVTELQRPDDQIGTSRNYELEHLMDPPLIATQEEIDAFVDLSPINKIIQKLLPVHTRKIYKEASFTFDKNFFKAGDNLYLKGYRQSEKYFYPIIETLKKTFVIKDKIIESVSEFARELRVKNNIAIHIRRGDFADETTANYHGILSNSYYEKAIEVILKQVADPVFYIFTDDVKWVKNHMTLSVSANFVSGTISTNHYEDFYLMSGCRHNIIANSSFSWWAAYLNANPDKIVIAPKKWFGNAPNDTKDLYPKEWLLI